jgi:hypothetical protein
MNNSTPAGKSFIMAVHAAFPPELLANTVWPT